MNESLIKSLIKMGEGVSVEFKECKTAINKNVYETICAFLNRSGGELLLGAHKRLSWQVYRPALQKERAARRDCPFRPLL